MKRRLIIEGPTSFGTFFIRDADNNIWDGSQWRGFGHARQFDTFRAAWIEAGNVEEKADVITKKRDDK